jgi:hypothetical protein
MMHVQEWKLHYRLIAGFAAVCLAVAVSASAAEEPSRAVHHSSDFGWEAGQDVTEQFTRLLTDGTLKAGDELVLDHTYRINIMKRSPRPLPANFTLSAVKGAGFDVYGFSHENNPRNPVLELGDRNTLRNLTITCEGEPTKIVAPKRQARFFKGTVIYASGKDDILLENCRLDGLISHNIKLAECRRPKIIWCHIVGGYWSVYLLSVTDAVFWRCLFEKSTCDGIKTGNAGSGEACRDFVVENCVFQDNSGGDGIDTTGGFDNSVVRNTTFRRLGVSGMDIKSSYGGKKRKLEGQEPENKNILIENCTFHDMPNGIVLTTAAGKLTVANVKKYAVHDIDVNNCLFGHAEKPLRSKHDGGYGVNYPTEEGEHMRAIFVKDAYGIRYRNMRLSGDRIMPTHVQSVLDTNWGDRLNEEAKKALKSLHQMKKDDLITGNVLQEQAPPIEPGQTDVPFKYGPQESE